MQPSSSIINLTDVEYQWHGRAAFRISVPSFNVSRGETVLLLGESGSGKSTLLSLICGTLATKDGRIEVDGDVLGELKTSHQDQFRAEKIGVIFQQFNLLPYGTVLDNILLPLRFAPERRGRVASSHGEAQSLCTELGLPDVIAAKAATLSVGQQQRVAVARALIGRPPIILADEPTSALDSTSQEAFLDLLFAQTRSHGTTLLMVSHDARLGERFDRVVNIEDIAQIERPKQ